MSAADPMQRLPRLMVVGADTLAPTDRARLVALLDARGNPEVALVSSHPGERLPVTVNGEPLREREFDVLVLGAPDAGAEGLAVERMSRAWDHIARGAAGFAVAVERAGRALAGAGDAIAAQLREWFDRPVASAPLGSLRSARTRRGTDHRSARAWKVITRSRRRARLAAESRRRNRGTR